MATPMRVASTAWRRLTPRPTMTAPSATLTTEAFTANQSQKSRTERPARCSTGVGSSALTSTRAARGPTG